MKVVAALCVALLVCGCAGTRPESGPGSGQGANYIPNVERTAQDTEKYDGAYAKCKGWARSVPFPPGQNKEALYALDATVVGAYAALATPATGGISMVVVLGAGALGGAMAGFGYWVDTPQRQIGYQLQETQMMNCMTREGFPNLDPSVKVTWVKSSTGNASFRATGRDTYNAEKLAKAQSCGAVPMATLVQKGPGYENYTVPCDGGSTLNVRCEFGHCRETGPLVVLDQGSPQRALQGN